MSKVKLKIETEDEKKRLDLFLVKNLGDFSRSQIQKLVKNGHVLINKAVPKNGPHTFLKENDTIEVNLPKKEKYQPDFSVWEKIKIIKNTPDYLIIFKPAGLLIHPTEKKETDTLANWIAKNYPNVKEVGDDPIRPGIVHRLDKDVSGILVIAKKQEMFELLKKQFKNRTIRKIYLALTYGTFPETSGEINFKIARSKEGKMVSRPLDQEGKESLTKYKVLEDLKNYSILWLELKTGRSHQLRTHLQAIDHPLVGDKLYKPKKQTKKFELKRPFLHAYSIGFNDLNNNWQEFYQPLPQELLEVIKLLKS